MNNLLDPETSPGVFVVEAGFAVAERRKELEVRYGLKADIETLAWQEVHALLLKAILDELVEARKGIRT